MTVTITRAQRDALYEELVTDLNAVGDIHLALDKGGRRGRPANVAAL